MTAAAVRVGRAEASTTRTLLGCGIVAGPLFVVVALAGSFTRAGFDLRRHPFSMLSLGELGWVQITDTARRPGNAA